MNRADANRPYLHRPCAHHRYMYLPFYRTRAMVRPSMRSRIRGRAMLKSFGSLAIRSLNSRVARAVDSLGSSTWTRPCASYEQALSVGVYEDHVEGALVVFDDRGEEFVGVADPDLDLL